MADELLKKDTDPAVQVTDEDILEEGIHHVNNPVLDLPTIVKKYLGSATSYYQLNNSYYFTDNTATVEVKVVSDEIIRVRLAPHSRFLDEFSYAVSNSDQHVAVYTFEEDEEAYRVKTNTVTCVVNKSNFLIGFEDREAKLMSRDYAPMHWEENSDFGGYYVYCTKLAQPGEGFYGLGDKPTNLNLRGRRLVNWNSDTYSFQFNQDPLYRSIPFYISLHEEKAHGIFFDNTFKTYFDFAAEKGDQTSFWSEGGELQYYYIHGPQMIDVVKRYHSLTGTHYLPPLWALGYHQCRWSYYPESKLKSLAREFRDRKIPCDALYLDIDYMDGYRCFTWDKKYFPDPKRMIRELAADGFRTVVIIDPGIKIDDNYWVFKEGKENRYFCRRGDDYFMEGFVWPGRCEFPDFTNKEVREWWGTLFKGLVEDGVAGVWNDMNEPAVFGRGTFPNDVRHNLDGYRGSHRKAHNIYGMQMVRATYDGLKTLYKNKRPFTITRAAFAGTQRYSSVWTGDNVATWEHLRLGLLQLQRLSVSGISFCGTDIGGFSGEPDGELFARWIQFGVFSPFMRAHSAGDTREREPWSFGEDYEKVNRQFIELRYKFLPYIYSVFWEQARYGFPILRPVLLHEQTAENMQREEEFSFGHKVLVSPVIQPGQTQKMVYLPTGGWYDYWDDSLLVGGEEHAVDTPIDRMPIFIKAGTVLPEYPVMQHVDELRIDSLKLLVYFAEEEINSFLYEDHGDTFAYEQQIYLEKRFVVSGSGNKLKLNQYIDGLYTERYETYSLYLVGIPFVASSLEVDGVVTPFIKDDLNRIVAKVPKDFRMIVLV
ncbi:alpha-glucosidase [bacterium A37T11]|nr:alpha-glucosidase [bacterium A37T11]